MAILSLVALTYTRAGAQTQLDAFDTALKARDWAGAQDALNSYRLIHSQLPQASAADGFSQSYPSPDSLQQMLDDTRAQVARAADRQRRVARGRTSYGR